MNDFESALQAVKDELCNEKCVKEYFYNKNIVDNSDEIKNLDEEMRFHQKQMCKNKENDELYLKEKEAYQKAKDKLDNNPIWQNYLASKEEVFSLLVDIKQLLG